MSTNQYALSTKEIEDLKAARKANPKAFPNPHNNGSYRFIIDALYALGPNKPHTVKEAYRRFQQVGGREWFAEFQSKKKRNSHGKPADQRFLQNCQTLQRTNDYGLALLQVGSKVLGTKGCVIDLTRNSKGELMLSLNTNSAKPAHPGRAIKPAGKANAAKPAVNATKAVKRATKPVKGKKRATKALKTVALVTPQRMSGTEAIQALHTGTPQKA